MRSLILFSALIAVCYGTAILNIPNEIDWNARGKVTPVVDQTIFNHANQFYSAVGALESRKAIESNGTLVALSIQQIVDCAELPVNSKVEDVYKYIKSAGGLNLASSYPEIKNNHDTCLFKNDSIGAYVDGFEVLPEGDEEALRKAVAQGPVAAQIDASHESLLNYIDGIYYNEKCTTDFLNHDVLVVGYGSEDGQDFWLVMNSWGKDWGLNGFVKMARNRNNNCNIASHAVYPILSKH